MFVILVALIVLVRALQHWFFDGKSCLETVLTQNAHFSKDDAVEIVKSSNEAGRLILDSALLTKSTYRELTAEQVYSLASECIAKDLGRDPKPAVRRARIGVVDPAGEQPLKDAAVTIAFDEEVQKCRTLSHGICDEPVMLPIAADGKARIIVEHDLYSTSTRIYDPRSIDPISPLVVPAGDLLKTFRFFVQDSSGRPASGVAEVLVQPKPDSIKVRSARCHESDERGSCLSVELSPGSDLVFTIAGPKLEELTLVARKNDGKRVPLATWKEDDLLREGTLTLGSADWIEKPPVKNGLTSTKSRMRAYRCSFTIPDTVSNKGIAQKVTISATSRQEARRHCKNVCNENQNRSACSLQH